MLKVRTDYLQLNRQSDCMAVCATYHVNRWTPPPHNFIENKRVQEPKLYTFNSPTEVQEDISRNVKSAAKC